MTAGDKVVTVSMSFYGRVLRRADPAGARRAADHGVDVTARASNTVSSLYTRSPMYYEFFCDGTDQRKDTVRGRDLREV